jgi:hypothetical protein
MWMEECTEASRRCYELQNMRVCPENDKGRKGVRRRGTRLSTSRYQGSRIEEIAKCPRRQGRSKRSTKAARANHGLAKVLNDAPDVRIPHTATFAQRSAVVNPSHGMGPAGAVELTLDAAYAHEGKAGQGARSN